MASFLGVLNWLLPFATPGTPIIQDLIHLAAICALLYFAPQLQARLQTAGQRYDTTGTNANEVEQPETERQQAEDIAVHDAPNINNAIPEADADREDDGDVHIDNVAPGEEGQAGPAHAPDLASHRNVGAKKAKSLARRDQKRAYHEFMRSQGDAQRARDAEGAAEREVALAAERERRRAAETTLEAKRAKERQQKKDREAAEWQEANRRRLQAIDTVKRELDLRKMCDLFVVARQLGNDVDEEWIEKILNASNLTGSNGDSLTMITSVGWAVRVTADEMAAVYKGAVDNGLGDDNGRIDHEGLGSSLQTILQQCLPT